MRGVEIPENDLANCMRSVDMSSTSKCFTRSVLSEVLALLGFLMVTVQKYRAVSAGEPRGTGFDPITEQIA